MERDNLFNLQDGRVFVDYGPVSMVITAVRNGANDPDLAASAFPVIREALSEMGRAQEQLRRYPADVEAETLSGELKKMTQQEAMLRRREEFDTKRLEKARAVEEGLHPDDRLRP